jgi:hypothetical protein
MKSFGIFDTLPPIEIEYHLELIADGKAITLARSCNKTRALS